MQQSRSTVRLLHNHVIQNSTLCNFFIMSFLLLEVQFLTRLCFKFLFGYLFVKQTTVLHYTFVSTGESREDKIRNLTIVRVPSSFDKQGRRSQVLIRTSIDQFSCTFLVVSSFLLFYSCSQNSQYTFICLFIDP